MTNEWAYDDLIDLFHQALVSDKRSSCYSSDQLSRMAIAAAAWAYADASLPRPRNVEAQS